MFKHEVLNVVHFSEPFFAFEPLPFDEFFPLFVIAFLFPAKRIQQKFILKKFAATKEGSMYVHRYVIVVH